MDLLKAILDCIPGRAGAPVNDNEKDKHVTELTRSPTRPQKKMSLPTSSLHLLLLKNTVMILNVVFKISSAHVAGMKVSQSAFWTVSLLL
jgi:hypothetical protein